MMDEFIKNLKKEFEKGVAVVGAKSKEIIETTKIKSQIEDLEKTKRQLLQETGEIVYQMSLDHNYNGEEAIKEKCQLLTGLDQQIKTKKIELKEVHHEAHEAHEAQEAIGKTVCESCGAVMEDGIKFCSNCGARIVKVEKD